MSLREQLKTEILSRGTKEDVAEAVLRAGYDSQSDKAKRDMEKLGASAPWVRHAATALLQTHPRKSILSPEQRATLIALVQTAWTDSLPVGEVPGGAIDSPAFVDWFNAQIDAALAEPGAGGN